jgi:hypothetical protein
MKVADLKAWPIMLDLLFQSAVVMLVASRVWFFGSDQYQQRGSYRHILVPIALAIVVSLICGALILRAMFRRIRTNNYAKYLSVTELFASRGPKPVVTLWTVIVALLTAPFRAPLLLLTPTAIVTLLAAPVPLVPAFFIAFCNLFLCAFHRWSQ